MDYFEKQGCDVWRVFQMCTASQAPSSSIILEMCLLLIQYVSTMGKWKICVYDFWGELFLHLVHESLHTQHVIIEHYWKFAHKL